MHQKRARRILGGFEKSQLSWVLRSEEEGWLSLARSGLVVDATCVGRGRWKSQNRKNVYLSPYVETFNSKVIKGFIPELRSHYMFFGIPMFYVYMLWTFYVRFHISVPWVWYTNSIKTFSWHPIVSYKSSILTASIQE